MRATGPGARRRELRRRRARRRRRLSVAGVALVAVVVGTAALWANGDDTPAGRGSVAAPESGVYFGAWRGPGPGRPDDPRASMEALEAQIDRRLAIDRRFYPWNTMLPTAYDRWTAEQGRIPMLSVSGRDAEAGDDLQWEDIALGVHDEYLDQLAQSLADWAVPLLFIFEAEPERNVGRRGGSDDYRAAWRHLVGRFRAQGADNVAFMWTTEAYSFLPESERGRLVDELYPGDDVIDWIAVDPYNFFRDQQEDEWVELADEIGPWYAWARARHPDKPLALAEWGSKEDPDDPGRKARWFRNALRDLRADFPHVRAVVYFDERKEEVDGTVNDWRVDTSESSLGGFIEIAQDPYFEA